MLTTILTLDPALYDHIATTLDLQPDPVNTTPLYRVSRAGPTILVHRISDATPITDAIDSIRELFFPEMIIACIIARSLGSEVRPGDIILPNVFLEMDPSIADRTVNEKNRDADMGTPRFLTVYERQEDFDCNGWGLSVGGIALSGDLPDDDLSHHNARLLYEAMTIDTESYRIVSHLQDSDYPGDIRILHAVAGTDENNNDLYSHATAIVRYIIDSGTDGNLSEEPLEDETEDVLSEEEDW